MDATTRLVHQVSIQLSLLDQVVATADRALRTIAGTPPLRRAYPAQALTDEADLSADERAEAAALMRVNHVGEICAQALYEAQALGTPDPRLRKAFAEAAREETDHLAWTERRIAELGGRTSLLNPLWYGGAFAIGLLAARLGDRASLGFMAETEAQVEQHLQGHLDRLPPADAASRAVVTQMQADEVRHGQTAMDLGGASLPLTARLAMRLAAKVMTTTARYV
jgi:ubiquinone biosynthesis monooxygenase Coq7